MFDFLERSTVDHQPVRTEPYGSGMQFILSFENWSFFIIFKSFALGKWLQPLKIHFEFLENGVYGCRNSIPFSRYLHCSMQSDWEVRWQKISNFFRNINSMVYEKFISIVFQQTKQFFMWKSTNEWFDKNSIHGSTSVQTDKIAAILSAISFNYCTLKLGNFGDNSFYAW